MYDTNHSWYTNSLPNLKSALISKIESLHQKNMSVTAKSNAVNQSHIQSYLNHKSHYQQTVLKAHKKKISQVIHNHTEKKKFIEKYNYQHITRANQNYQRIEENKRRIVQKHTQKLNQRQEKAELKRQKFSQIIKTQKIGYCYQATQKLSSSNNEDLSICNTNNNNNDTSYQSRIFYDRYEASQYKRNELQTMQLKKSMDLLNISLTKLNEAQERRQSWMNSRRNSMRKDQKIRDAIEYANARKQEKQSDLLSKTVTKHKRFASRISQLCQREHRQNRQKQKLEIKHFERVAIKREDLEERSLRKHEQNLQRKQGKAQNVQLRKKQMLQTFKKTLRDKTFNKQEKSTEKVRKMQSEERRKGDEQLRKEKASWLFLTSLKQVKDRIISENLYETAQLGLLRS